MRVNLYDHEMKFMESRVEHVRKTADTGITFHGLRLYTEPPLMHQPGDDDSSAITLWVPWTRAHGHNPTALRNIAHHLLRFCDEVGLANQEPGMATSAQNTQLAADEVQFGKRS